MTIPSPDRGLALSLTFRGGDTRTPAPRCQKAAPPPASPERSRAGGSAKGPGAVRFRGKGPQVGAAAAECERFRWEITSDNPARDGAARQETSSPGRQLRAKGEGCLSVNAQQPAGQPRSIGQRPIPDVPSCSLLLTFQDAFPHARELSAVGKKSPAATSFKCVRRTHPDFTAGSPGA